jgi:uncharacterized protein involved in type VI secretion and phage assembly
MSSPFFGKYRGIVTDIQDPMQLCRIKATVPDVTGDGESGWAMPCFPFGGASMGFFALPTVGAGVWIEFEHGDPDYPIWVGCWFGASSDLPSALLSPPYKKVMLCSEAGSSITLDDTPGAGGIALETSGGQKLKLTASSVELDNGSGAVIKLSGSQVSVNNGALDVV